MTSASDGLSILPQPEDVGPRVEDAAQVGTTPQRARSATQTALSRSAAVVRGLAATPDEFAEAGRRAHRLGIPLHRALGMHQAVQASAPVPRQRTAEIEAIAARSPTLAKWLEDPSKMGASLDDVERLQLLDAALQRIRPEPTLTDELATEVAGGFYDKLAGYMGALAAGAGEKALNRFFNVAGVLGRQGRGDDSTNARHPLGWRPMTGPAADLSRSLFHRAAREAAAGEVVRFSRLAAEQRAMRTEEAQRYFQGVDEAEGLPATVRHMLSSPRGLALLVFQNLSFALDPLVGGAAGFAAGGVPGAAVGAFAGGVSAEYGPWINGRLSEMNYDLTDPDQVQAAYANRPLMAQLRDEALKKGVATAGIDAAFQVLTGGVAKALAGPGLGRAAVRGAAGVTTETLGEFGSELGGKYSATGELDLKGAAVEAVAGFGQSAGQAGIAGSFSGVSRGTAPLLDRVAVAAQARVDATTLRDVVAAWRASHVARRLPEGLAELIAQHAALGDGERSAAQAFIDLETWDEHAGGLDTDPIELLDAFVPGEGAERYGQAEETGQVVIPLERYVQGVAGDTANDALVDLTRFREAGVTLAEADDAVQVGDLPGLDAALGREVAAAGESSRLAQESAALRDRAAELDAEIAALEGVGEPVEDGTRLGQGERGEEDDAIDDLAAREIEELSDLGGVLDNLPEPTEGDWSHWKTEGGRGSALPAAADQGAEDAPPADATAGSAPADTGAAAATPDLQGFLGDDRPSFGELNEAATGPAAAQRLAALRAERAEVDGRLERIEATEQLAAQLEDRLTADLVAAGETSERAARLQALPLVQGYRTLAERTGQTLADLLDRFQTRVGVPGARGSTTLAQDGRGEVSLGGTPGGRRLFSIERLAKADRSTFLHESGHVFVEILGDLASDPDAPAQLADDYAKALAFMGLESREQHLAHMAEAGAIQRRVREEGRNPTTEEAARLAELAEPFERFARGFEAYLREGKAPSAALRRAFAAFRQWLIRVYRAAAGLDIELTDEVRGLFDRLLATDEEIAAAQHEIGSPTLPDVALAGLDDEERAQLAAKAADAHDEAVEGLERDLRRLEADEERADRDEALAGFRATAAAEVDAAPAVQALYLLRDGTLPNGAPLPDGVEPAKIARASVPAALRQELTALGVLGVEGETLDAVLEAYDAASPEAFVAGLRGALKRDELIETSAREELARVRGRRPSSREVRARTRVRLANQSRSELLELKVRLYRRKVREAEQRAAAAQVEATQARGDSRARRAAFDAAQAQAAQAGGDAPVRRAAFDRIPKLRELRARAHATLARMPLTDIRPHLYAATAARMGRLSDDRSRVGDWAMAAQYAERERLNHELHRVANQLVRQAAYDTKYLRGLQDGRQYEVLGLAGWSYQDAVIGLLDRFSLAQLSRVQVQRLKSLREWHEKNTKRRADAGDTRVLSVPPKLLDEAYRVHWRDLTAAELHEVRETAQGIYKLASTKNQLLVGQQKRKLSQAVAEVATQIEGSQPRQRDIDRVSTDLPSERRLRLWGNFQAVHKKAPMLARLMDQGADAGAVLVNLIRPINAAQTAEVTRKGEAAKALAEVFGLLEGWNRPEFKKDRQAVPGVRQKLTHEDRLGIALLFGNEHGRARMFGSLDRYGRRRGGGLGLTEAEVAAVLQTLTASDVDFLNALYAYYDTWKPEIAEQQRRLTGVSPEWVEAIEYETPGGKVTGGYHPLKYRGSRPQQMKLADQADALKRGAFTASQTRHGYVQARSDHVDLKPRIDLGVTIEHVNEVIHDLTHRETILDLNRILRSKPVHEAIVAHYGEDAYAVFNDMVTDVAAGPQGAVDGWEQALAFVRKNTTTALLALKAFTGVVNLSGLFQSMQRVGGKWVIRGMAQWLRSGDSMEGTVAWVQQVSPFMAQRATNAHQVLFELSNQLAGKGKKLQAWEEASWWVITKTQVLVDMPTWLGAYQKAQSEGVTDAEAVLRADQAVRDSQGSGEMQDLAAIQRDRNQWKRLFSVFIFYTNTTWNLAGNAFAEVRRDGLTPQTAAKIMGDVLLLYVAPALFYEVARLALRGTEEDDPEDILLGLLTGTLGEALGLAGGGALGVRELTSIFSDFDYSGPAGVRLIPTLQRFRTQMLQGEFDDAARKALFDALGALLGAPSAQINTTWDGLQAVTAGEATGLRAFTAPIFGRPLRDR